MSLKSKDPMSGDINVIGQTFQAAGSVGAYRSPDKNINFGFDEVSSDSSTKRQVALQLKKSSNTTRLISTVPVQVTSIQYSSDSRIKKDIVEVDTGNLLDRMRKIELREYGYTDEWRKVRDLENEDVRVRGVIAQELRQVFPEHIQILDELKHKEHGIDFKNFHQVDKQVSIQLFIVCMLLYVFVVEE